MNKQQSLLDQIIANDPELKAIAQKTLERFQVAAQKERENSNQAEIMSAEDLSIIVNYPPHLSYRERPMKAGKLLGYLRKLNPKHWAFEKNTARVSGF